MKNLLLIVCLLFSTSLLFSQTKEEKKEKISQKIKSLEKRLEELELKLENSRVIENIEENINEGFNDLEDFPHFSKEMENNAPNKAVLGVQVNSASAENGTNITHIYKESGAEKAGLKNGDLILAINNKKIKDSEELINSLKDAKVGDKVEVRILRSGEVMNFTVELGKPADNMFNAYNYECNPRLKKSLGELRNLENELERKIEKRIIIKNDENENDQNLTVEYLSGSPNPSNGKLNIQFSGKKEPFTITVNDMNGKEIFKEEVKSSDGTYNNTIQVESAEGAVIIKVRQGDKVTKSKVIIQK